MIIQLKRLTFTTIQSKIAHKTVRRQDLDFKNTNLTIDYGSLSVDGFLIPPPSFSFQITDKHI